MTLRTDSKYPARRAYVVKVHSDATPDCLAGRLENLVTGCRTDFTSATQLLHLIASDIGECAMRDGL
jgi:hypothetical protein